MQTDGEAECTPYGIQLWQFQSSVCTLCKYLFDWTKKRGLKNVACINVNFPETSSRKRLHRTKEGLEQLRRQLGFTRCSKSSFSPAFWQVWFWKFVNYFSMMSSAKLASMGDLLPALGINRIYHQKIFFSKNQVKFLSEKTDFFFCKFSARK